MQLIEGCDDTHGWIRSNDRPPERSRHKKSSEIEVGKKSLDSAEFLRNGPRPISRDDPADLKTLRRQIFGKLTSRTRRSGVEALQIHRSKAYTTLYKFSFGGAEIALGRVINDMPRRERRILKGVWGTSLTFMPDIYAGRSPEGRVGGGGDGLAKIPWMCRQEFIFYRVTRARSILR